MHTVGNSVPNFKPYLLFITNLWWCCAYKLNSELIYVEVWSYKGDSIQGYNVQQLVAYNAVVVWTLCNLLMF